MRSRREFLTKDLINIFKDTYRAITEEPETDYFSSYELCYAIVAEASLEELQNDARTLGIDPAGKSKYELARLVYKRVDNTAKYQILQERMINNV